MYYPTLFRAYPRTAKRGPLSHRERVRVRAEMSKSHMSRAINKPELPSPLAPLPKGEGTVLG
jgi:hypothetical protein